jgi:hypothetical protein
MVITYISKIDYQIELHILALSFIDTHPDNNTHQPGIQNSSPDNFETGFSKNSCLILYMALGSS